VSERVKPVIEILHQPIEARYKVEVEIAGRVVIEKLFRRRPRLKQRDIVMIVLVEGIRRWCT